jgi:hypothetical protein
MLPPQLRTLIVISMLLVSFMAYDRSAQAGSKKAPKSAGDRGLCSTSEKPSETAHLIALVVNPENQRAMKVASEYPTLWFFYTPDASTPQLTGELIIRDRQEETVMESRKVDLPNQTGIVGIQIKSKLPLNQPYHWYFSVTCKTDRGTKKSTVDSWLRRIEAKPEVATQLNQAKSPEQIADIYRQAGFWADALTTLANEKNQSPKAQTMWSELLREQQLESIESQPILPNP